MKFPNQKNGAVIKYSAFHFFSYIEIVITENISVGFRCEEDKVVVFRSGDIDIEGVGEYNPSFEEDDFRELILP